MKFLLNKQMRKQCNVIMESFMEARLLLGNLDYSVSDVGIFTIITIVSLDLNWRLFPSGTRRVYRITENVL